METVFTKRIFTAKSFFSELGFVVWNLPGILRVFLSKRDAKHLYEKAVIVTDAVNGCVYCSWLDAKLAMKRGISEEEIKDMLKLQFHTSVNDYELTALLFSQHYAETNGIPEPEMTSELFDFYGDKVAKDIILIIRATTFGNLYFNTWGAVISRFRGRPAPNSNVFFEIAYFLLNSIIILPVVIVRKLDSKAIGLQGKIS